MEWNWDLSIGFRQAVSETISLGTGGEEQEHEIGV
jgi:hypothetical protein